MNDETQRTEFWPPGDGEMAARIRTHDWSATPLGPVEGWPCALRVALGAVLANPHPSMLLWGPDLIVLHNDSYLPLLGGKPSSLGRRFFEVWAEARDAAAPLIDRALAGESLSSADAHFSLERGTGPEDAWFDFTLMPVRDEWGRVAGVLNTGAEVTGRHRAEAVLLGSEQREAFLLELSDALRPHAEPLEVQRAACRVLRERLGADRVAYAELDPDQTTATLLADDRAEGVATLPDDSYSWIDFDPVGQAQAKQGRTSSRADVEAADDLSPAQKAVFVAIGVRAFIIVPLVKSGRLVAFIAVHFERPHESTPADIALVEETAERTWAAVERARAEAALRESETRFRTLAESIEDVFYVTDLERGRLDYLSPSYERIWERPAADLMENLGRFAESIHPEDQRRFWDVGEPQARGEPVRLEYRILRPDGSIRWIFDRSFPIAGAEGKRSGGIATDITDRKASEDVVRETEARLRRFGEASSDVLWIRNADTLQWEYVSPAFEAIYGMPVSDALAGENFGNWIDLIHEDDRERAAACIERVREGERVTFEYRVRRPDGGLRWLRNTDFPMRNAQGRIERFGGVGQDVTEMKRIESELIENELRLRTLTEGIPQLVWRAVDAGSWTWASPQWCAFTGQVQEGTHARGWLEAVHPDDREPTMRAWADAVEHGLLDVEHRLRRASDGAWLWHHTRALPVRGEGGRIVEWLGTATDINELRSLQERQGVLVDELQHRTRNLMGVVRSMADKTARGSADMVDFRARYRDRLESLARVQGLLSRLNQGDRVTFDELIRNELSALDGEAERVTLQGPAGVRLRSSTVQTLAMALHELATNAVKYGALGQPDARLAITWSLEPDGEGGEPWLRIDWRESGVRMPAAEPGPTGSGQGRELIERALPYQLSARTSYVLGPDGVRCVISMPVSASTLQQESEHA